MYAEQEAARKRLLDERAAQLKDARTKTSHEVSAAKERIARELAGARSEVEASAGQLAAEIAKASVEAQTVDRLDKLWMPETCLGSRVHGPRSS